MSDRFSAVTITVTPANLADLAAEVADLRSQIIQIRGLLGSTSRTVAVIGDNVDVPPTAPEDVTAPTSAEEAYKVAGMEARWVDYAGLTRAPFNPADLTVWTGATTVNGEALVASNVEGVDFPTGVRVQSSATLKNCRMPYVLCSGGTPTLEFCDIGNATQGVTYPDTGDISQGNDGYYGADATVKCSGNAQLTIRNCVVLGGIDAFRAIGSSVSLLTIERCWIHSALFLARDQAQDSSGSSAISHNDMIQVNSPAAGPNIALRESRVDWFMGLWVPIGEGSRIGSCGSYDHSTGVLTEGTWWFDSDPAAHALLSGQQHYNPNAGENQSPLPDFQMTATTGVVLCSSGSIGDVLVEDNYLSAHADSYVNIVGTKEGEVTVSNNTIWKPPDIGDTFSGKEYVRLTVSSGVDTWTGNVNQFGATVAKTAE